jgi:hypothetical protein
MQTQRPIYSMMKAAFLTGVALITTSPANAADWRYCLATSPDEKSVYLSEPFQTNASMSAATDAFSRLLAGRHLRHQGVQCPRSADQHSALAMREYAIGFNQSNGREIANVTATSIANGH